MRALFFILGLSALHFVAAMGLFSHSFGSGMSRFDTGEMPSLFDRVCDAAVDVLWFPFTQISDVAHIRGPSVAEWLLFLACSLVWGIVLYGVIAGIRRLWHYRFRHEHVA